MPISKKEVNSRLQKAAARLRELNPTFPMQPENLTAAAEENDLPITVSAKNDAVANALVIIAFCREAKEATELAIERVWGIFQGDQRQPAV